MNDLRTIFKNEEYLYYLFELDYDSQYQNYIDHLNTDKLNTSTFNEYIPVINLNNLRYIEGTFLYYTIKCINSISKLNMLLENIIFSHTTYTPNLLRYTDKGVLKTCYIGCGYILDENYNFMFLAAFRSRVLNNCIINNQGYPDLVNMDISKGDVKIFITNSFIKDYRKIYNTVKKAILQPYVESGCELSIVDSDLIKASVYGNEFESSLDFETLEGRLSFIELLKNTIL